jgi:hypothetical protein
MNEERYTRNETESGERHKNNLLREERILLKACDLHTKLSMSQGPSRNREQQKRESEMKEGHKPADYTDLTIAMESCPIFAFRQDTGYPELVYFRNATGLVL